MSPEMIWGAAGLALVIADMIFGSFFLLFLGVGALVTALLAWAGILDNPTWQWICFAVVSVLGVALFRKKIVRAFGPGSDDTYSEYIGVTVKVISEVTGTEGKVFYRGAEWMAKTTDGSSIEAGQEARIIKTDGIVLLVGKKD